MHFCAFKSGVSQHLPTMPDARLFSMKQTEGPYLLAALCVLVFIFAQTFQELSYRFWIPVSTTLQGDLLTRLLTADQVRALAVMGSILLLAVPFTVVALRYREIAPIASTLGLIFATAFIGFEISDRSIDFFVIGRHWAPSISRRRRPGARGSPATPCALE